MDVGRGTSGPEKKVITKWMPVGVYPDRRESMRQKGRQGREPGAKKAEVIYTAGPCRRF